MFSKKIKFYVQVGYEKKVGRWMLGMAMGIYTIIFVGGYTRLSQSGLSMTSWTPYLPMSSASWNKQFQAYKKTPQYKSTEITMQRFKRIFFVELLHRWIGLGLGALFTIGAITYRKRIKSDLWRELIKLFGVGALQGGIGWWMVKSGFQTKPDYQIRPKVSPYRLTLHLLIATYLYSKLFLLSLKLLVPKTRPQSTSKPLFFLSLVLLKLCLFNIFSGCIVAGIDAGKVYNTWPLYNGEVYPKDMYTDEKGWRNFFETKGLVQFNHRNLAYLTYILGTFLSMKVIGIGRMRAGVLVLSLLNLQVLGGINTLLSQCPVQKCSMHQMSGFTLYTSILYLVHILKPI